MPMSEGKQLIYAMGGWVGYLLLVYFSVDFLYYKIRGVPPTNPRLLVLHKGAQVPALKVWEERNQHLRKFFVTLGVTLVLLPLVLPILARIFL